jgi:hypothetical protein
MRALPRSLATLGIVLTLLGAGPAAAARHARAPKSHILTVPELVSACAAWARNYEPGFGAFWDESIQQAHLYRIPNGPGTFQFDRCMAAPRPGYPHGFALNDVSTAPPAPVPQPPTKEALLDAYLSGCVKRPDATIRMCTCEVTHLRAYARDQMLAFLDADDMHFTDTVKAICAYEAWNAF